MQALINKAMARQWCAETDINWDQSTRKPLWIRWRTYTKLFSNFYHGEMIAQAMCRRLLSEIDDPLHRQFVETQLADEMRHAAVYKRYIARFGQILPISHELKTAVDKTFAWSGSSVGLIVGFHVVFEGGTLSLLEWLGKSFRCPLWAEINALIMPDEARHVAFGVYFMKSKLAELDETERSEIYHHVSDVWKEFAIVTRRRQTLPVRLATRLRGDWLMYTWERQKRQLQKFGLASPEEMIDWDRRRLAGAVT